jgi:glycosyltransferase involved in cell wall biosynthesis
MKYSFVIIVYNEEENIKKCIESIIVQKGLGTNYEILVVDDGSKDATASIVDGLAKYNKRINIISDGGNHGRGYGRYIGVERSKGEYICMVDGDILLPKTWLQSCLKHIIKYDVVGGIAVPDGDVAYIYRRFKLTPKVVAGSTTITGNNGMYRRDIFFKVSFNKNLRDGEDVDFNHRAQDAGISEFCIPGLTVEHQESKSFVTSMVWLYQSGVGATRQLLKFREIRLPDMSFAITFFCLIGAVILSIVTSFMVWLLAPVLCVLGASFLHTRGKFRIQLFNPRAIGAILTDALLIISYYAGRSIGMLVYVTKASDK